MKKALSLTLALLLILTTFNIGLTFSASAKSANLVTDGTFENYTTGLASPGNANGNNETLVGKFQWYDGYALNSGIVSLRNISGNGWTGSDYASCEISEAEAHGGIKSMFFKTGWQALYKVVDVEKDTDYVFSYYYYQSDKKIGNQAWGKKIFGLDKDATQLVLFPTGDSGKANAFPKATAAGGNAGANKDQNYTAQVEIQGTLLTDNFGANSKTGEWDKVEISFNSGNSEKVALPFYSDSTMYIDDVCVEKYIHPVLTDGSFENFAAGYTFDGSHYPSVWNDKGISYVDIVDGWSRTQYGTKNCIVDTVARTGSKSMRLMGPNTDQGAVKVLNVEKDTDYQFSFWYKQDQKNIYYSAWDNKTKGFDVFGIPASQSYYTNNKCTLPIETSGGTYPDGVANATHTTYGAQVKLPTVCLTDNIGVNGIVDDEWHQVILQFNSGNFTKVLVPLTGELKIDNVEGHCYIDDLEAVKIIPPRVADSDFENYTTGQTGPKAANGNDETLIGKFQWYDGYNLSLTNVSLRNISANGWTGGEYAGAEITEAYAHSGVKSMKVTPSWQRLYKVVKVDKNTDYLFTYYYYQPAATNGADGWSTKIIGIDKNATTVALFPTAASSKANAFPNETAGGKDAGPNKDQPYGKQTIIQGNCLSGNLGAEGKVNEWDKVIISFNSGDFEKVMLPFASQGDLYIDDVECIEQPTANMPAVSVQTTGKNYVGGTAKVEVENFVLLPGAKITYTAHNYENAAFLGWYLPNGTLYNSNLTFNETYSEPFHEDLIAKFNAFADNLVGDGSFESLSDNTDIVRSPSLLDAHWKVAAYDWHHVTAVSSAVSSGHTVTPYEGNRMLQIQHRNYEKLHYDFTAKANTAYRVTFKYLVISDSVAPTATFGVSGHSEVAMANDLYTTGEMTVESNKWNSVAFNFKSADETNLMLNMYYTSKDAQGYMYFDDFCIMELADAANVSFDMTEAARIEPINYQWGEPVLKGDTYNFKVVTAADSVTVTVGGNPVTPVNGIYSVTVNSDTTIKVVTSKDNLSHPAGYGLNGEVLNRYNKDVWLKNVSEGDTVYNEVALFYPGRSTVKLLYPISEVISVRTYSLDKHFVEDVDFRVTDEGLLQIIPTGALPVYKKDVIKVWDGSDWDKNWLLEDGVHNVVGTNDTEYPNYAIAVTYKHTATFEGGFKGFTENSQAAKLAKTIEKLENGETVNIVLLGDSISCGWSSSGLNTHTIYGSSNTDADRLTYTIGVKPYGPAWFEMAVAELREQYPDATINFRDIALSGMGADWGKKNVLARLNLLDVTPDLMFVAFGVNDGSAGVTTAKYKEDTEGIISNVRTVNEDCEFVLVAPFLPNQLIKVFSTSIYTPYEGALDEIAEGTTGVAVSHTTSLFNEIIKSKECIDYLNTNINHGNDFTSRMYAQTLLSAIIPAECVHTDYDNDNICDKCGEVIDEAVPATTGISLTVGSDIQLNFYMHLPDESATGTMNFKIGNRVVNVNASKKQDGSFYFACPVNSLEMAETVVATYSYKGETYVVTYSVAEYLDEVINGNYDTEAKDLAKRIQNYGHYIQKYLEGIHNNVTIGDDGYTEIAKAENVDIDVDTAKLELADNFNIPADSANYSFFGRTVYFDGTTALNFYVTAKNGKALTKNDIICTKQVEVTKYTGNIYIVSIKDILATELNTAFAVTVDGELTLSCSVLDYCSAVIHKQDQAEDAVNAMAAFYEYYESAIDYAEATK